MAQALWDQFAQRTVKSPLPQRTSVLKTTPLQPTQTKALPQRTLPEANLAEW